MSSSQDIFVPNSELESYSRSSFNRPLDTGIVPSMIMPYNYKNIPKEPAVYKIKLVKDLNGNKTFKLVKDIDRFVPQAKYYGTLLKDVERTWHVYEKFKERKMNQFAFGAVGYKGMGKTEYLSMMANLAMDKCNFIVILVTEIQSSPELIQFLSGIDNCFIMFDEFGKIFPPRSSQGMMLTMFNNLADKHRIIACSDNRMDAFDEFFRDRTGRIYYLLEFDSIDKDVIVDYCKDNNVKKSFVAEILKAAQRVPNFSMDYIKGLVQEHSMFPNDSLDVCLRYLNLKILKHRVLIYIDKVTKEVEAEDGTKSIREFEFTASRSGDLTKEDFFVKGYSLYISVGDMKPTREELEAQLKEAEEARNNAANQQPGMNGMNGGFNPGPFGNPFGSRGGRGNGGGSSENLYLDNDDEVIDKQVLGDMDKYIYTLKGFQIHLRVQEKSNKQLQM